MKIARTVAENKMGALPNLPIGVQTFEKIREGGYLYVDKIKYLVDLIDNGSVYFLPRPRSRRVADYG